MSKYFYKPSKFFLISYSFFLIVFLAFSIYFYFNEKSNQNAKNRIQLQTLARIKSAEISRWYEERYSDALFLYSNQSLKKVIEDFSKSSASSDSLKIIEYIERIYKSHDFKNIFILNKNRQKLVSLSPKAEVNYIIDSLISAQNKNEILFSNFYIVGIDSSIDLDIYVPVFSSNELISTIILKIDPEKIIFPLIQNWYFSNSSVESFIVYKHKTEVVFINKLKFSSLPPLSLKLPVSSKNLPAALAVSGVQDIIEGVDYRGEEVLADIRRIKETPWFLITKQDLSEIYTPVTKRLSFILLLLFSFSAIGGISFLYFQSRQNYKNSLKITESTKKFELLYQSSNDPILIIENGIITDCNRKTGILFNLKEEEILNKTLIDFSPEVQPDGTSSKKTLNSIMKNVHEGTPHLFEWLLKIDKDNIYCGINLSPLIIGDKNYVVAVIRNITERKKMEDLNLRLLYAIEQSPVSVVITNKEGGIEYVNPKFSKATGYSFNEVSGKNPNVLKSGELSSQVYKELWHTILSGSEWQGEFHNKKKNGELFWERASISPIKNSFGDITNFIAIKEDITSAKEAEENLKSLTAELIQQNKYLEQFAYIISHNLRAPVANIIGLVNMLNDPDLSPDEKETMTEGLSFSVKKLDEVIIDLNDIIQIKKGSDEKRETVNFYKILDDIKNSISKLISNENVNIKADFSVAEEIYTLKSYLYSIFYNLISNSIKYKQPQVPPVIEIKSSRLDNRIEISFKDNGMGINLKEKGDQVFGLYKRFHINTEGKGMGLFMTKMQVEALGGKIEIKSEVNKGTEFIITFII